MDDFEIADRVQGESSPTPADGAAGTVGTVRVEIVSLVRAFQTRRGGLDRGTVARYATRLAAGLSLPPITVGMLNGAAVLLAGYHRVEALLRNGETAADAIIVQVANEQEAWWLAAESNLANGLQLKSADFRNVFGAYVRAGRHRSGRGFKTYRKIAAELGGFKAHTTIRNWMKSDFPRVARHMAGGEDFKGKGGLPDLGKAQSLLDVARAGLDQMLAAANGIPPKERQPLIRTVERALQRLKAAQPWEPAGSPDF